MPSHVTTMLTRREDPILRCFDPLQIETDATRDIDHHAVHELARRGNRCRSGACSGRFRTQTLAARRDAPSARHLALARARGFCFASVKFGTTYQHGHGCSGTSSHTTTTEQCTGSGRLLKISEPRVQSNPPEQLPANGTAVSLWNDYQQGCFHK